MLQHELSFWRQSITVSCISRATAGTCRKDFLLSLLILIKYLKRQQTWPRFTSVDAKEVTHQECKFISTQEDLNSGPIKKFKKNELQVQNTLYFDHRQGWNLIVFMGLYRKDTATETQSVAYPRKHIWLKSQLPPQYTVCIYMYTHIYEGWGLGHDNYLFPHII